MISTKKCSKLGAHDSFTPQQYIEIHILILKIRIAQDTCKAIGSSVYSSPVLKIITLVRKKYLQVWSYGTLQRNHLVSQSSCPGTDVLDVQLNYRVRIISQYTIPQDKLNQKA